MLTCGEDHNFFAASAAIAASSLLLVNFSSFNSACKEAILATHELFQCMPLSFYFLVYCSLKDVYYICYRSMEM